MKDRFKSVDVADVSVDVADVSVDVAGAEMISVVIAGACSLFFIVLSEKEIGGMLAIAKLEALKLSSALLN